MDFSPFQRKLLLRASSPSEYLHVLTAHWLLILIIALLGTLVLFTVISSQPTLYQAQASLQLNPNEPLVEPGTRPTQVRTDLEDFINDQVGILESQTVLESLVVGLGYHLSPPARLDQETEKKFGRLQKTYLDLQGRLEEFITEMDHPIRGSPEEVNVQRAVLEFRSRSKVQVKEGSHQVRLAVWGVRPEGLVTEVEAWIIAYRKRIENFSEESAKRFLDERKGHWGEIAREKKEALEGFRKKNPEVGETMHRLLQGQIIRQEVFLDSLRTRMTGLNLDPVAPMENDIPLAQMEIGLAEILKKKKGELEIQRVELLGQYPEGGEIIKAHDAKIQEVERSLQSIGSTPPPSKPAATGARKKAKTPSDQRKTMVDTLQKNINFAMEELNKAQQQLVDIETKMVDYRKLQADLQYAEDKVASYERSMDWRMEFTQGQKLVQVQVWDKPTASTHPVNTFNVLEAGYGTLGGLVVGFVLAFFKEFFRKTIRFKRDVVQELGLDVIGVIPRR